MIRLLLVVQARSFRVGGHRVEGLFRYGVAPISIREDIRGDQPRYAATAVRLQCPGLDQLSDERWAHVQDVGASSMVSSLDEGSSFTPVPLW